jgi:cytochrome c oxidase subunit IV
MSHVEETVHINVLPPDRAKIKKLWTTAGILLVITIIEFIIAFSVPHEMKQVRVWTFILLTIVKAAFIVGEFMHLRYEAKVLFWSVLIPLVFVVWMLVAFIYEGTQISVARFFN